MRTCALVVVLAAIATALAAGGPAGGEGSASAVECHVPGEWARGPDAAWLWNPLRAAGFRDVGCTGSAFDIAYGGNVYGSDGPDFSIWAGSARRCGHEPGRPRIVAGVRVHGGQVRLTWRAGRRCVSLSAGSSSRDLPPQRILRNSCAPRPTRTRA